MPFFGILWVASWINCSVSCAFSGSLIADYLSTAFKTKSFISISNPLVRLTNQVTISARVVEPSAVLLAPSKTFLPEKPLRNYYVNSALTASPLVPTSNFAKTIAVDSADKSSPETQLVSWGLKLGEENFCRTDSAPLDYAWANLPSSDLESDLESELFSKGSHQGSLKVFVSYKINQVLNSLFRWQDNFINQPKTNSSLVVVVRSDNLMPQQVRRNFWLLSQKSPDNILSDSPQVSGSTITSSAPKFQVWLKHHLIAEFNQKLDADLLAQRLQQLVSNPKLDAQQLQLGLVNSEPAIKLGDRLLFLINDTFKDTILSSKELIAIKLVNNLRLALGVSTLDLAQAQMQMYRLSETSNKVSGLASWYGSYFHGRQTANGESYNQYAMTVAHPTLPFDTYLKITNPQNNKSVIARVNDRGPYVPPRILDLSVLVARCIDSENNGVVMVEATVMQPIEERKLEKK